MINIVSIALNFCRKKGLLVLSFFLAINIGFSQPSGEVIYKMEMDLYKGVSEKKTETKADIRSQRSIKKVHDIAKTIEYKLSFGENKSLFSMKEIMVKEEDRSSLRVALVNSKGVFYNDLSCNESFWNTEIFGKEYLIRFPKQEWKLLDEEKIIQGYRCKKAITHRIVYGREGKKEKEVEAWYAPQIPVSFGPMQYAGLPGLIVELSISGFKYYVTEFTYKEKNPTIKKPEKGEEITLKEYYGLFSTARDNFKN